MRILYFILKYSLKYGLWVFYPKTRIVNKPKKRFASTIFMCNHAASFMDPLIVAESQPPIVFFMTRSDVFKPFLKPILWASHMLPIYRSLDGENTKEKNEEVFKKCYKILNQGRSLLVFSEGFTDDIFIRRLKPIKKGAVRIGFGACEANNWHKKIYLQSIGVNYEEPNRLGSGVLISNGEPVCLNDFKEAYFENPNKVINELTQDMELDMRKQLTDVRNAKWAETHEYVMRLTKEGMSPLDYDKSLTLKQRWKYSKQLADWFNSQDLENNSELIGLKNDLKEYFKNLNDNQLEEHIITKHINNKWSPIKDVLYFVFLFPFFVVGLVHHYIPYFFTKKFVEKSFKRPVFWGSVKMMLGSVTAGVYNIILMLAFNHLIYSNGWFWFVYYFSVVPLTGIIAYHYKNRFDNFQKMKKVKESGRVARLIAERKRLISEIKRLIPVS